MDVIKTTEFILQMDELYGIKLYSVKLFKKKKKKSREAPNPQGTAQ